MEELTNFKKDQDAAEESWGELLKEWEIRAHFKELKQQICLLQAGEPFSEQLKRQEYRPIVLLSTQRYFMLTDDVREQLFHFRYEGRTVERNLVLFDESPYFSENVVINHKTLSLVESALRMGIPNDVQEKEFVINEYQVFKQWLQDIMTEKERKREAQNVYLYWNDKNVSTITKNDDLFFEVIEDNRVSINNVHMNAIHDLYALKELMERGAILKSEKRRYGKYDLAFHLIRDNRRCFYLGQGRKFFVFDATADVDPRYSVDYVEFAPLKKTLAPMNLTIESIRVNTSKANLGQMSRRDGKLNDLTTCLCDYINKRVPEGEEVLIVTYNKNTGQFFGRYKKNNIRYFGNMKGFNHYREFCYMAHVGLNRFPDLEYLFRYYGSNPAEYEKLSSLTEEETIKLLDSALVNRSSDASLKAIIDEIARRSILVDFEQNIFKLKIRDVQNKEPVRVILVYDYMDAKSIFPELKEMLEERFKPFGVRFEYLNELPGYGKKKAMSRKAPAGKASTDVNLVLGFLEKKKVGDTFTAGDLKQATGLSDKKFQMTKKNDSIRELLDRYKTEKKGFYRVA